MNMITLSNSFKLLKPVFISALFIMPLWAVAQCGAPAFSSITVTGTNSATLCWISSQADASNHKWNLKLNDVTAGVIAALDLEVESGSAGLAISPGVSGPGPIQICYDLSLPSASTEYTATVAEQCDGVYSTLSTAAFMTTFTTNAAAAVTPPTPTQFKTISQTVTHIASFAGLELDPSPNVGAPSRLQFTRDLLDDVQNIGSSNIGLDILYSIIENVLDVNIPNWIKTEGVSLGIPGVIVFELDPKLELGITADYGGFIGISKVGKADVDISYPVDITIQAPGDQQFGCGDKVLLETAAEIGEGATIAITPAFYETELGPIFENTAFTIRIGLKAKVKIGCIEGECAFSDSWDVLDELGLPGGELVNVPFDIGTIPPFIKVCEDVFDSNAELGDLLACSTGTNIFQMIFDHLGANPQQSVIDAMFTANNHMVEITQPDLPSSAGIDIPEFFGRFKKVRPSDLKQTVNGNKLIVEANGGKFEELSRLSLDLISLLELFNIPTSYSLGGGIGEVDLGDLNLNLTTDLDLNYTFDPTSRANINLGQPMSWRVLNPVTNVVIAAGTSQIIPSVKMGNNIEVTIPDDFTQATSIDEEFLLNANFTTNTILHYNNSLSIELFQFSCCNGSVDFALIPEFEIVENEMPGSPKTIEDHTLSWDNSNFNKPTETFSLTPDQTPPVIQCKPVTVTLNQWGTASILSDEVLNAATSYDLPLTGTGTIKVLSVSPNAFSCDDISGATALLAVEDGNCNQATCISAVTVIDDSAPEMLCPDDFVVENDAGACGAVVDIPTPTVFDNCSYTLLARYQNVDENDNPISAWSAWLADPDGFYAVGRWKIEWQAKDPAANEESCIFYFDVIDTELPVLQCDNPTYVFNGEASLDLNLSDFASATDNCEVAQLSIDLDEIFCEQLGEVLTVTATAIDIHNKVNTCTSTLTIGGLPCGWSQDPDGVGCVDGNSISYDVPTEVFTATSTNCYYASPFTGDELAFGRRTLCGNGSLTVEVTNIEGTASGWAGIVMRESSDSGAKKVQLTTNMGSTLSRREVRSTANGAAFPQQFPGYGRSWLQLVRTGNQFSGFTSNNGIQWYPAMTALVSMNSCIEMGLVVTNYQQVSTVTATFANVMYADMTNSLMAQAGPKITIANSTPIAHIFPNPTTGKVYLQMPIAGNTSSAPVQIRMYNALGAQVAATQLAPSVEVMELDQLSSLANGVYFIQVAQAGQLFFTKRIVLEKD